MPKKETRGRKPIPVMEKKINLQLLVKRKHYAKCKKDCEAIVGIYNSKKDNEKITTSWVVSV